MKTVLVVDDKELLRDSVGATLQRAGFSVIAACDGPTALEMIARRRPNAVITDLKMPGMTGVELIEKIREIDDDLPVVLMTAFGTIETAVKAIKLGAFDYITKPFEGDELLISIKRAIEHAKLKRENDVLRRAASDQAGYHTSGSTSGNTSATGAGIDRLVGDSPSMRRVKEQVMAVAESHSSVLICGESGTGKEVVAHAIHELSPRAEQPFLAVNCAALSEALLESELFGHERGAYTGAERMRKGRFELADRGTLLLDEISEISVQVQAKLLRVLQEQMFERVGSSTSIGIDVRVMATSNRDLPRSVSAGEFRQDLFFRLNVLPIHLPPMRDRLEDVPVLCDHFLTRIAAREGRNAKQFSDEALSLMQQYEWPGNVRELQNICERAAVLSRVDMISRSLIEPWLGEMPAFSTPQWAGAGTNGQAMLGSSQVEAKTVHLGGSNGLGQADDLVEIDGRLLEDIERDAIIRTLSKHNGHRQNTAKALGIGVRTLGLKLKKWKEDELVDASL